MMTGTTLGRSGPALRSTLVTVLVVVLVALAATACAAGPNTAADIPSTGGDVAGFWLGVWHGVIVPVTFIISLFSDTVGVYEVHNSGGWYDFGFLLGASVFLGGGGAGAKSSRN